MLPDAHRVVPRNPVDPSPAEAYCLHMGVPRRWWGVRVLGMGFERPRCDGAAFEGFYRAHYAPVVRLAYSLTGSRTIAEELAQEAFVTAHGRWDQLHGFDRPDLWVRRVVINRSISFRRREATERRVLGHLHDPCVAFDPELQDDTLWAAMRELSPRQAEALALFYVEDQPLSEVAKILGLGEETVKTHLKRGRAALAAKLGTTVQR